LQGPSIAEVNKSKIGTTPTDRGVAHAVSLPSATRIELDNGFKEQKEEWLTGIVDQYGGTTILCFHFFCKAFY